MRAVWAWRGRRLRDAARDATDDAAGVGLAVSHLAELGHRRIVHLAGPQTTSTGVIRARAYRAVRVCVAAR